MGRSNTELENLLPGNPVETTEYSLIVLQHFAISTTWQHWFPTHAYDSVSLQLHIVEFPIFPKAFHPQDSFCYLMLPRIRILRTVLIQNKLQNTNISMYVFVQ